MSELKAFESERIYWAVEQVERVAGDIDSLHLDDNLFYIKSEADKVIAELKAENESLLQQNRELCQALHVMYSKEEYDKQKYKRCMAMKYVEWLKQIILGLHPESILYRKAFKRERKWKELADKFKEAK